MEEFHRLDGVLWLGSITPVPYCPKHKLQMDPYTMDPGVYEPIYDHLRCEECTEDYIIPRDIDAEKTYIHRKLKALSLKNVKVLNLDDEAIPIAEAKESSKDDRYFVKALFTESKVGKRLVVYVGEKGKKQKIQIFVEPELKRLAFDQKDTHPSELFLKLEGTFDDGSSASMEKGKK